MIIPNYTCPTCRHKYFDPPFQCVDCGTELGWKCASCNHGNALVNHYCSKCGTAIPTAIAALINEGKQIRIINIPQYNEPEINELLEEGARLVAKRAAQTFSQTDIDKLFD